MVYNFKSIQTVPEAAEFVDIVLSKIQRKTPTVIHPNFKISRIRQFYMRKVKFAEECFVEKLDQILNDFPKLDEIHPFYTDLMNVLYDRDHYKLALAQIHTAKRIIDNIAKDYVKLLKFGDSLFRCKQLKRAALGRMATAMKRQKDPLQYLERVRQHLGRLPSIDPNTRTLLICGYPNVGKSSFINKLTKADVDVQPYAFTTKSLFVGHMDYKNLRWQVIDTPGILDHPLEQRNTIEMQSITALAHLRSAILYFMDLSEQCGYSVKEQMKLFHSIKPLFANKPTFVMFNKIDIVRPDQIGEEDKALLKEMENDGVKFMQLSCHTEEGVMEVRDKTCDELLAMRVETRMKAGKVGDNILNRLHLAQPAQRDEVSRPAFIPEAVLNRTINPDRKLERDIELENGGAGVYNINLKKNYDLKNHEWKFDVIPEIMDGKNVADFFDADIEKKLAELEAEEARLEAEGFYDVEEYESEEEEEVEKPVREKAGNRPTIPRKHVARQSTTSEMVNQLKEAGISVDEEAIRGRSLQRKRARSQARETSEMDVDSKNEDVEMEDTDKHKKLRSQSKPRTRTASRDRSLLGVKDVKQKEVADKIKFKKQRMSNLMARAGEADRHISTKMPKHLFAGKRKSGKTDRR